MQMAAMFYTGGGKLPHIRESRTLKQTHPLECVSLLTLLLSKLACAGHRYATAEKKFLPCTQRDRFTTSSANVCGEQAPQITVAASCHTPKSRVR